MSISSRDRLGLGDILAGAEWRDWAADVEEVEEMTELIEFRKESGMTTGEARKAKDALDKGIFDIIKKFEEETECSVISVNLTHKESIGSRVFVQGLDCAVKLCGFEK